MEDRYNLCVLCEDATGELLSYGLRFMPIMYEMLRYKQPELYYILEFVEGNGKVIRWDWDEKTHNIVKTNAEQKIVFK